MVGSPLMRNKMFSRRMGGGRIAIGKIGDGGGDIQVAVVLRALFTVVSLLLCVMDCAILYSLGVAFLCFEETI